MRIAGLFFYPKKEITTKLSDLSSMGVHPHSPPPFGSAEECFHTFGKIAIFAVPKQQHTAICGESCKIKSHWSELTEVPTSPAA